MFFLAERRHKHFHPELHNIMRNSIQADQWLLVLSPA